jgi:hypothetical protein
MKCANHSDRAALGYCSGCGKALCSECLVRLSTGNYCDVCANPGMKTRPRRPMPWWLILAGAALLLVLARLLVH